MSSIPKVALFAVPLVPTPPKLAYLLDRLCEHRPWFNDFLWDDPKVRRTAATLRISDAYVKGFVWEVYRGPDLIGLLLLDSIVERTSAQCHFVFFDRTLGDKRALCLDTMRWAFDALQLKVLRVEIPTHVRPLVKFARRLGFRYESEIRDPPDATRTGYTEDWAAIGSRKRYAMLYQGEWVDALLLSVTAEEFAHGWPLSQPPEHQHRSNPGVVEPVGEPAQELPAVEAEPLRERHSAE